MKPIEEIFQPDQFYKNAVLANVRTLEMRPYSIADFYEPLAKLNLNDSVPADVRQEFHAACHTFVYSFLYYDLSTVAEHYAYAVLEMALRSRFVADGGDPNDERGLSGLLKTAFSRKWLLEKDYEIEIVPGQPICRLRHFAVPLRNNLSHGRMHRFPQGSEAAIEMCSEVINRLFPD